MITYFLTTFSDNNKSILSENLDFLTGGADQKMLLENGAAGLRTAHSTAGQHTSDSNTATNHSIYVVLWLRPLLLLLLLFLAGAQLTVSSRISTEAWPFVRWKQRRSAIRKTSSSGVGEDKGMVFFETVRLRNTKCGRRKVLQQ